MLSVVTAGGPKSGNRSTVPLNDMLDVIKNDPRHCSRTNPVRLDYKVQGGWVGKDGGKRRRFGELTVTFLVSVSGRNE